MPERSLAATKAAVESVIEPVALEQRPPFADLLERARQRRHRRWQTAAAGVVVVVGAGLLLGKPVQHSITAPPATHQPTTTPPAPVHTNQILVQAVTFASPDEGYAVVGRCGSGSGCSSRVQLLHTVDGGRSWTRVSNPTDNGPGATVQIESAPSTGGVVLGGGDQDWYSADLVNWHARAKDPVDDGGTTERVPRGWSLDNVGGTLVATNPLTNHYRRLAHEPDLSSVAGNVWATFSGPTARIWAVSALDGSSTKLAYSDDLGRSWHRQGTPPDPAAKYQQVLTDASTERIFLLDGDENGRLLAVHRLDRPGGTWVNLPIPSEITNDPNPGTIKAVHPLPDGELLYDDGQEPLRTEDNGSRTVGLPMIPMFGTRSTVVPQQSVKGTLIAPLPEAVQPPDGVVAILVSTDAGHTWTVRQAKVE